MMDGAEETCDDPTGCPDQGDARLAKDAKNGNLAAFAALMRRHNQRLFRLIRSVLRTDHDAEDAMQDAYLSAFKHLHQFEGRAEFGTWLLKIGFNQALARKRGAVSAVALDDLSEGNSPKMEQYGVARTPEQQASRREMIAIMEAAVDRLPDDYRQVFVLRFVDSLDSAETAEVLGLTETAVRQRLHRAREMLQVDITKQVGSVLQSAFSFLGPRCSRMVEDVMRRIAAELDEFQN